MGPPYTDDPGCKYIVIEDPWPGDKTGRARDQIFYNGVLAWVRFMLGRVCEAECIYYMNTRDEVIVQLPEHVDIVPILGAHIWRNFLSDGDYRDRNRVSYVFEYDYRKKGEPGNHNWNEKYADVSGDPPPRIRFPVKIEYPRPDRAMPRGRKCGDLALPLPPTWQPPPDVSAFTQYQRPTLLTPNAVTSANAAENPRERDEGEDTQASEPVRPSASGSLGKIDPYEEETKSLRLLQHDPEDIKPRIKQEPAASDTTRVKTEQVKHEAAVPYAPSEALVSAFEYTHRQRTNGPGSSADAEPSAGSVRNGNGHVQVKSEEKPPSTPSDALTAAFYSLRGGRPPQSAERPIKVRPEPKRATHQHTRMHLGQEPHAETTTTKAPRVTTEPSRGEMMRNGDSSPPGVDARWSQALSTSLKRVKDEYSDDPVKKVKTEHGH